MSHIVSLKYNSGWQALEWAKAHCHSYITNEVRLVPGKTFIDYHFGDKRDATMFSLRWA